MTLLSIRKSVDTTGRNMILASDGRVKAVLKEPTYENCFNMKSINHSKHPKHLLPAWLLSKAMYISFYDYVFLKISNALHT